MTTSSMGEYRVDYKTNEGKGNFTVTVMGTDLDDVKDRFDRTTQIFQVNNPDYEATILTITKRKKAHA